MKRIGILTALCAAAAAVMAQSNDVSNPEPTSPQPTLQAAEQAVPPSEIPLPLGVSTNASAGHAMTLSDCIQAALAHNFDVQIQRYNPQVSLYNLNAAYQDYDLTFDVGGNHSYNDQGGTIQNGVVSLPTTQSSDNFNSAIGGL